MAAIDTISAAMTSFSALKDIAKAMIGLRDAQAIQAKVVEFQEQLIDAQEKIFAVNKERTTLIERVSALEKEVTDLEAWEAEKQRYELKTIGEGSFAYVLKPDASGSEPPHQICANCYADRKKSILQKKPTSDASRALGMSLMVFCPRCGKEFVSK